MPNQTLHQTPGSLAVPAGAGAGAGELFVSLHPKESDHVNTTHRKLRKVIINASQTRRNDHDMFWIGLRMEIVINECPLKPL